MMISLTVCNGKYRYIFNKEGAKALRHGEEWRETVQEMDGFILALAQELEEARAERDELAAHIERLNEAGKAIQHELAQWALTEKDPETSAAMCQFDQVARETPTISLAHRDLIKQAEVLESQAERQHQASKPAVT